MSAVLAALPALFRHWRAALAGLALLIAGYSHAARLKAERALERCRGEAAIGRLKLEQAEEKMEALARDSRRRIEAQTRGLELARQANAREGSRIEALKRSAASERAGADCALSEALKQAQGAL